MSCLHGVSFKDYCELCASAGRHSIDLKGGIRVVPEGSEWLICARGIGYLMADGTICGSVPADPAKYMRFSSDDEALNYLETVGLPADAVKV
jgi:hypothetical protein